MSLRESASNGKGTVGVPATLAFTMTALTVNSGFPLVVAGLVGVATGGFCWWTMSSDR